MAWGVCRVRVTVGRGGLREKVKEESRKKREKIGRKVRWRERGGKENNYQCLCECKEERERGWLVLRTLTVGYVGGSVTVCHS